MMKMADQITPTPEETEKLRKIYQEQKDERTRKEEEKRGGAPTSKQPVSTPKPGYKKGGKVRGGGCEQRGKTKGKFV
jgi:hypothetical protein